MTFGAQDESSKVAAEHSVVNVPFFYFGGTEDKVCRHEFIKFSQDAGLLPHCKVVTVDAGHWCMYKRPKEIGDAVLSWLKETF
jgi:pimeloyl-ACP methyl ester carboxylesterase